MCTDGQPRTSCVLTDTNGQPRTSSTDVRHVCVLTDTHGHARTATDVLCVLNRQPTHRCPVCADRHTRTHTDSHGRPVCADGQPQTATDVLCVLADTHRRPVCTEQTAHVGQNHPNSPREGPAC
ncbi:unnamed protein product [Brassica rapa]|uniref:Uncharacterized protein n=1 Tax=Brassica campestris TaxID=3711 RepID=A0A8D9DLP9_BRACM|nr:unnamed protein product [Brassica rapa]